MQTVYAGLETIADDLVIGMSVDPTLTIGSLAGPRPVLGVLEVPVLEERWLGVTGEGATLNGGGAIVAREGGSITEVGGSVREVKNLGAELDGVRGGAEKEAGAGGRKNG